MFSIRRAKYRIVKIRGKFYIEKKSWFFWKKYLTHNEYDVWWHDANDYGSPNEFDTLRAAETTFAQIRKIPIVKVEVIKTYE